jgi:hypothetical protein
MKNLFALVIATVMVAGVAAPSFADEDHCVFKDKSLCKTESLSTTTGG